MIDGYKRVWKYKGLNEGKHNWLRSHLLWIRAGDIVYVEGDKTAKMATTDTFTDEFRGPRFHFVISNVDLPNV